MIDSLVTIFQQALLVAGMAMLVFAIIMLWLMIKEGFMK